MYKYFYETTPDQLGEEDWMAVGVKAMVSEHGGEKYYRLYRVRPFEGSEYDQPQGERIYPREAEKAVAETLFPAALYGMKQDF